MVELRPARILPRRCGLHRRMARACGRDFAAARYGNQPCLQRGIARGQDRSALRRGRSLALIAAGLAGLALASAVEAQVVASRIWPARDYTRRTIDIDAGHGGEDPGAIGRRGTREKNVTLMIAKRLKALIEAEPNMRAFLTRDGDYFLPLNTRVEKARQVHADLLVSIHADSFKRSNARGSSVFALSERRATSEMARLLAQQEHASDLGGG